MFTNERILVIIIFLLIFGAGIYFTVNKFRQEIGLSSSPSPSPTPDLKFVLTQTPQPVSASSPAAGNSPSQQQTQAFQSGEIPLSKNKKLSAFPGILREDVLVNKKASIVTAKGNIEFAIYPEATKSASNFIILAANGFYDGLKFHRVESGFVVQGGDPLGNGTGGPGYTFEDEPVTRDYLRGTVAYANAGSNTNGSQFFIVLADSPNLPKQYTIFGQVISGMDVVDRIVPGDEMIKILIQPLR